jgi:uncharacterized sulfatase
MKGLLRCVAAVPACGLSASGFGFSLAGHPEPVRNIVFILADDLGVMDSGCYGSDYYETPNIDRLAREGMRFTSAYAAQPVCSPTRVSILTGRYPARLHLTAVVPGENRPYAKLCTPDWIKYLRHSELTYAEAFRDAGFATFHVGKWHVNSEYAGNESPVQNGFSTVIPGNNVGVKTIADPHSVEHYTLALENFMTEHRNEPFIAVLSHDTVHVPLYDQDPVIQKYAAKAPGSNGQNNPVMAAMIERLDGSVGRVLNKISALGLEQNTAVVFFSDNGGLMRVVSGTNVITATSNLPYRGGKSQLYEGGIRVPLIVRWPGVAAPGSICAVPVISTDLYPTFLEMAGQPLRPAQHLDGLSLVPLLRGGDRLNRNALYWHCPSYHSGTAPHGAVRCGDWKLVEFYESSQVRLYDLKNDSGESNNLSVARADIATQLRGFLRDHLTVIGAQMPYANTNYIPEQAGESFDAAADLYENNQAADPRTYVTESSLNYGAIRAVEP